MSSIFLGAGFTRWDDSFSAVPGDFPLRAREAPADSGIAANNIREGPVTLNQRWAVW